MSEQASNQDRGPSTALASIPRGTDAQFRVELAIYKGKRYVSFRQWNKTAGGEWLPDRLRGCSVRVRELDEVIAALSRARELVRAEP